MQIIRQLILPLTLTDVTLTTKIFLFLFDNLDMADSDQRREFLEEIQLMKAVGSHKNIVSMLGCCTVQEPMFLLVEYVPCGDLLHYLRKHRSKVNSK